MEVCNCNTSIDMHLVIRLQIVWTDVILDLRCQNGVLKATWYTQSRSSNLGGWPNPNSRYQSIKNPINPAVQNFCYSSSSSCHLREPRYGAQAHEMWEHFGKTSLVLGNRILVHEMVHILVRSLCLDPGCRVWEPPMHCISVQRCCPIHRIRRWVWTTCKA